MIGRQFQFCHTAVWILAIAGLTQSWGVRGTVCSFHGARGGALALKSWASIIVLEKQGYSWPSYLKETLSLVLCLPKIMSGRICDVARPEREQRRSYQSVGWAVVT